MGAAAPVLQALSCSDCARYVCNDAEIHSQCCDQDDACNCDVSTHETAIESAGPHELDISLPWLNIHTAT